MACSSTRRGVMMRRRKLLFRLIGVAVVSGLLVALALWIFREPQAQLPEGIIGSWKSANDKTDAEITFWRSGDFQMSKTFGDKVLVKGKGTWKLQNRKLLLSI